MNLWKHILPFILFAGLFIPVPSVAQPPLTLELQPDRLNPAVPTMGDHLQFWSTITNAGHTTLEGLVAWISLVEIDPGNEQPVDLEDWSALKAITGTSLGVGESLRTDWSMRLIKGGDYRVVVSVTDRSGHQVSTSPTIEFHVRQKPVLQAGRLLPIAAGVPLLIIGLLVFTATRLRRGNDQGEIGHEKSP